MTLRAIRLQEAQDLTMTMGAALIWIAREYVGSAP